MIRSLVTILMCGVAIFAADTLFRSSVLSRVRPIVLVPNENAVVDPPVTLHWDGPQPMRVKLGRVGEELADLGEQRSPFTIPADRLERDGGYRLLLQDPVLGNWVSAQRNFQYHEHGDSAQPPPERTDLQGSEYLFLALNAARDARDKARERSREQRKENAELRHEIARLQLRIQDLGEAQDADAAHAADLENRLVELANELRGAAAENAALRVRLASVIPCTAWGYFSYPRPQTIPVTRRVVLVSNLRGDIFRDQAACEVFRREDGSAASACFCVGNTWGE
ncbi:MAG TPA: bZIP transcription factor [Terriglobales bacterium]|nr:bZIP transcription factor [Terriglobales bacterium]